MIAYTYYLFDRNALEVESLKWEWDHLCGRTVNGTDYFRFVSTGSILRVLYKINAGDYPWL